MGSVLSMVFVSVSVKRQWCSRRKFIEYSQPLSLSLHIARWDGSKNSNGESWRKAPWFQATAQSPRVALLCECLVCCCCLVAKLCLTPWTIAHQAPVSMGFSRQEYWSGLPFPSPGDLPEPGVEPASSVLVGRFFTVEAPGKPSCLVTVHYDSVSLRILCLLLMSIPLPESESPDFCMLFMLSFVIAGKKKKEQKLCRNTM